MISLGMEVPEEGASSSSGISGRFAPGSALWSRGAHRLSESVRFSEDGPRFRDEPGPLLSLDLRHREPFAHLLLSQR